MAAGCYEGSSKPPADRSPAFAPSRAWRIVHVSSGLAGWRTLAPGLVVVCATMAAASLGDYIGEKGTAADGITFLDFTHHLMTVRAYAAAFPGPKITDVLTDEGVEDPHRSPKENTA